MAVICPNYRLLFLMSPRTASTAVGRILRENLDGHFIPQESVLDSQGRIVVRRNHCTLEELMTYGMLSKAEADSYLKVTTVRNPFDSLVSWYLKLSEVYQPLVDDPSSWVHRRRRYTCHLRFCATHTFDEWIEWRYSAARKRNIRAFGKRTIRRLLGDSGEDGHNPYTRDADVVMRFETLQRDLDGVLAECGAPPLTVPFLNVTRNKRRAYHEYYTPRARQLVEEAKSAFLRRWGYEFGKEEGVRS